MKNCHSLFLIIFLVASYPLFGQNQTLMPMPTQTSSFSGNSRGYYFVAPSCFTITGAMVPTDASSENQSIAIVRFNATPPTFSSTTNDFTLLFLVQNDTNPGIYPLNIQVEQGDVIGVLGQRGLFNSYSSTGNTTTINGQPVVLNRIGMQFPLTTTAPQELWTELSSNISRVNLYYDTLLYNNISSTATSINSFDFTNGSDTSFVSVWNYGDGSPLDTVYNASHTFTSSGSYNVCTYITNSCGTDTLCTAVAACVQSTISQSITTCEGDPINIGPNYYSTSGVYSDTLTSIYGCDSIVQTNLTVIPTTSSSQQISVCFGQEYMFNGNSYTSTGTYLDTLTNVAGCDSLVTTQLTVSNQLNTTIQVNGITLSVESGNQYQWIDCDSNSAIPNETSASFSPTENGSYAVIVSNGNCSDTSDCQLVSNIGINELYENNLTIYPNPAQDKITIEATGNINYLEIRTVLGQIVLTKTISNKHTLDVSKFENAIYFITIISEDGKSYTKELIIE
jgi:hypothetical protein